METSGTRAPAPSVDRLGREDALEHLARVGLAAYGVVHLLVAWLALQLAWNGRSSESADQAGALATLADSPFGTPLLWIVGIGLIALAAWQAAEALRWRYGLRGTGKMRRRAVWKVGKAIAKAVVYAALAVLALRFATGAGQQGSSQQEATAGVFGLPGGRFLVGAAALVLVAVGVQHVKQGITRKFLEQIDLVSASPRARRTVERLGRIGFPAKGVALALVGLLLGWAAWTVDPDKASGLDGAMHTVLSAPLGWIALTVVAVGIAAFGAFCLVRARYPERN